MPTQLPDQVPAAPQFNELSVLAPLLAIYTSAYLVLLAAVADGSRFGECMTSAPARSPIP